MATLPCYVAHRFTHGDADHDGRPEVYAGTYNGATYAIEWRADTVFEACSLGYSGGSVWAFGDADRDGKADIVTQYMMQYVRVYEAPTDTSLPTAIVWAETVGTTSGVIAVLTDLDRDSLTNIVLRLADYPTAEVYENTGDNSFRHVATLYLSGCREFAVGADMDRDGRPELVTTTFKEYVTFHEAVGNDTFRQVAVCSLNLVPRVYTLGVAAAPDMDRDDRPEAVVIGSTQSGTCQLAVLESPANDSFCIAWTTLLDGAYFSELDIAVGDVDGDSVPEFALADGLHVRIFRCAGPDQYEQVWQMDCYHDPVGLCDMDTCGHAELLIDGDACMYVYKYVPGGGVAEPERRRLNQVAVEPTVVTHGDEVRVRMADGEGRMADKVEVLDVAGRTVALVPACRTGCATWQTRGIAPGAYFVRVSSGTQSVVRKVLVLR
jgi:hypothetical protein